MSRRLPRRLLWLVPALAAGLAAWPAADAQPAAAKSYLFCFWNVENLFDDKVDGWTNEPDKGFDVWFAKDKEAREQKLSKVCQVLLEMNGGKGPDVLALAEVESHRAADLVRQALNKRLKDPTLHYGTVVYKDPAGGRSIATALVTRLKVKADRTRLLGKRQRILKAHVEANGHELVVLATHWTSRVSDTTGRGRAGYADVIHADYKAAHKADPKVDYLVCGDFNDTPDDDAVVKRLRATGDEKKVAGARGEALLFNPFAAKAKKGEGTHSYGGKPYLFDQVVLSPGLLDGKGWSYKAGSAKVVERIVFRGRPDRFGGPSDKRPWKNRGASDHFPVTVALEVAK